MSLRQRPIRWQRSGKSGDDRAIGVAAVDHDQQCALAVLFLVEPLAMTLHDLHRLRR